MEQYIFLVPLFLILVFLVSMAMKIADLRSARKVNLLQRAAGLLLPKEGTGLHRFYCRLLRYSGIKLQKLFMVKIIAALVIFLVCLLIGKTNSEMYEKAIFEKFDYTTDVIYQTNAVVMDKSSTLQQEIHYLTAVREQYGRSLITKHDKGEAENIISSAITEKDRNLLEPRALMANKIYYRLADFYQHDRWPMLVFLLISLFASTLPDLGLLLYNFFAKTLAKKELRFLKKMIILNGSIKPVDFMQVLGILIQKSKYHRTPLKLIEDMNKRNSVTKKDLYYQLIRNTKDVNEKLFYEKLEQANCFDFDQAILNIENDFKIEKRTQARKVRKYIEATHAVGIIMFMLLVMLLIIYLLTPWLKAYNTGAIY